MCGIAGVIGWGKEKGESARLVRVMTDSILHRGPDDEGHYADEMLALGMRRLSIIDIAGGKQPIASEDGNLVIVFNGEIYNYRALREDLITRGYTFKTHTDTEVILHLFEVEGSACLSKLRGMFAFAIWNKKTQKLFLARDYFGIKPLYYLLLDGQVKAFGSEIKSILALPGVPRIVNDEAVGNYLAFQYNPLNETFFKGIWKLPPGNFMEVDLKTGKHRKRRYFEFAFASEDGKSEEVRTDELVAVLEDSVKYHMVADVPVGAFLSGGIDSGIIAALAQKNFNTGNGGKISTFTIGFNEVSEARAAEVSARHIGTNHTATTVSHEEYFRELQKVVWHFDEPVADPSAVALYFLAREARKKVKVVLSGEGADELFGGYNVYLESYARRRLEVVPRIIREYILRPLAMSKLSFRGKNFLARFFTKIEDRYIGNANIFSRMEISELWKGKSFTPLNLAPLYGEVKNREDSEKMQYIDISTWLPGDILAKADKMTMAHSLELRVPFLDRDIADFARRLPPKLKWKNYTTKYLLRRAADRILTPEIARRKKLGFPTPVGSWFSLHEQELSERILKNPYMKSNFNTVLIEKMIADHVAGRKDNARKIYALYMLALWHDVFVGEALAVK
ncbi:MAG: Asparagine synthetase [Parcubacteria group bacterium GW2011_GWA1_47_8]|nr:MAG: Asparagine synthetase [Parcubacteria group bacterium GW2011_GWA1_47_8]KKW07128.1 MAG: Asparagine synthetase [Parcubacteria group bacterium GW2011_GWA2_49_16]